MVACPRSIAPSATAPIQRFVTHPPLLPQQAIATNSAVRDPPVSAVIAPRCDGWSSSHLACLLWLRLALVALKVTPASIRAFIQYFASDIIGVKYTIPRECIAANKALAEALFYRRIAPYVFRYADAHQRRLDDYWRMQRQRCRFVNPKAYYVMEKFLVKKEKPPSPSASTDAAEGALTPPPAPPAPAATPNTGVRPRKGSQSNLHNAEPHNNHAKMNSPLPCLCYYCQTLSLSQRLQRLPVYEETMRGEHFARSARVLSWLRLAVTPRVRVVSVCLLLRCV